MSNQEDFLVKNEDEKIKKIIQEQSDQMLTMVDVINVYDIETKALNKKIQDLEIQNYNAKSIFNNQLLLFVLTFVIFYLLYFRIK